jgi:lantibiotic modifying enzyme
LEEIASILCDSADQFDSPGVLAGVSGLALFMFYYARFTGDSKYAEVGTKALEKAVEMINDGYKLHTFCSGISGLAWTCEHLERYKFIDREGISFINDLEPHLLSRMEKEFGNKHYDFLHGGMGVSYYFLSKRIPNKKKNKSLYSWLQEMAIECEDGSLKWESKLSDTGRTGFNICLSHGMSSIVVVLTKLVKQYPHIAEMKVALLKTIQYILQQQLPNPTASCFPSYSLESDEIPHQSRLAWCYGDLGVTQAILQAAKALGNKSHENEAMKILLHNCNRKDLEKNFVRDAGICHGASGISHIFNRLYANTKMDVFKDTSIYWMGKTIEMDQFSDGLAGYKSWRGDKDGWENSYSLLGGITGIGLSMLSQLNPDLMNWDECLLLS